MAAYSCVSDNLHKVRRLLHFWEPSTKFRYISIHRAAGPQLARECATLGGCATGDAKITGGYSLPAKHIIHGVGPVYHGGDRGEAKLLALTYQRSLEVARDNNLDSIAFPCISTGVFGYPIEEAATIALRVIREWLSGDDPLQRVICCCYSEDDAAVYQAV